MYVHRSTDHIGHFFYLLSRPYGSTVDVVRTAIAAVLFTLLAAMPHSGLAQGTNVETSGTKAGMGYYPVRTDSPQDTIDTFIRLSDEMESAVLDYQAQPTFAGAARIALLSDQLIALFDLERVATVSRRETGIRTFSYLMDIFGRIGAPDTSAAEFSDAVEEEGIEVFRVPGTPLQIVRITDGPRKGEYLFSASTVQVAPRFFQSVQHLPLNTRLLADTLTDFGAQLTGPLFPAGVVEAVPEPLKKLWLDTPIWKVLAFFIGTVALGAVLVLLQKLRMKIALKESKMRLHVAALMPLAIIAAATLAMPFLTSQINLSGRFATLVNTSITLVTYLACAWLVWLGVRLVFEWIISTDLTSESVDVNLLRLIAGMLGVLGVVTTLAFGGQAIGLPIVSVVAGLGIGGLAVALAVRPTLENLIGGVILFSDRPARVGDFCSFEGTVGTVEKIGARSTKIRAVDRTLISVPNAQFVDMKIINWAQCDEMLIKTTIGVRYETSPDQLRHLLAAIRRMLHAHPRIAKDTVRVRFAGFGDSALEIDIRIYAMTREWNEFFAIREDVYLRIMDIIATSGTGVAFPSQTLYVSKDTGINRELGEEAEAEVANWRQSGQLPFPRLPLEEIDRLSGSLDYPPRGSVDISRDAEEEEIRNTEPLSAPMDPDDLDEQRR